MILLSVQIGELREVAELRWDGASELIPGEVSERTTMNQMITQCDFAEVKSRDREYMERIHSMQ